MVYIQSLFTSLVCNTKRCIFKKRSIVYICPEVLLGHTTVVQLKEKNGKSSNLWRWMENGCGSAKTCSSCPDHLRLAPKVNQTSSVLYNTLLVTGLFD